MYQRGRTEFPGRNLIAAVDAVEQGAKLRGVDADEITDFMGETLSCDVPVFHRGKHGSEKKHQPVGIVMVGTHTENV